MACIRSGDAVENYPSFVAGRAAQRRCLRVSLGDAGEGRLLLATTGTDSPSTISLLDFITAIPSPQSRCRHLFRLHSFASTFGARHLFPLPRRVSPSVYRTSPIATLIPSPHRLPPPSRSSLSALEPSSLTPTPPRLRFLSPPCSPHRPPSLVPSSLFDNVLAPTTLVDVPANLASPGPSLASELAPSCRPARGFRRRRQLR